MARRRIDRAREIEIVQQEAARRRRFELPGIQDLSKEQEAVRALPKQGRHLVIGGPGTGKTVVALIRARRHQRERNEYAFLVFNHLLKRASDQLFGAELSSATWETWLGERFRELTGDALPRVGDSEEYSPIDWAAVERLIENLIGRGGDAPVADPPFLVLDEGQDMPPEFYQTLVALGYEKLFVAADQNQRLREKKNSNRSEIQTGLAIDTERVIELKHNHRNSGPVAKLARAFYTGDPASPPVELPSRPGSPAWLCDYAEGRFKNICQRMVKIVDRDPAKLVGVIVPNNEVRERFVRGLRAVDPAKLDHGLPVIETFHGQHRPDVRFDRGGVLVINALACKGLEFDVAVLADIDQHHVPADLDEVRKLFYVMVARAREQVILLRRHGVVSRIEEILPNDPTVLKRTDVVC